MFALLVRHQSKWIGQHWWDAQSSGRQRLLFAKDDASTAVDAGVNASDLTAARESASLGGVVCQEAPLPGRWV